MTGLPRIVQRTPEIFYGAAVLFFVASVILTHLQLPSMTGEGGDPRLDAFARLTVLNAWLQAAEGGIYIAAYGVLSHILLAIWRDGRSSSQGVDE